MYYGYGMDYAYLGIIILSIVLGGITQSYINSQYKKWSRVPASMGKTGAQVARHARLVRRLVRGHRRRRRPPD